MEKGFVHTIDVFSLYLLSTCLSIDPSENEKKTDALVQVSAYINNQSINSRCVETLTSVASICQTPSLYTVCQPILQSSFCEERLRKIGLIKLKKKRVQGDHRAAFQCLKWAYKNDGDRF